MSRIIKGCHEYHDVMAGKSATDMYPLACKHCFCSRSLTEGAHRRSPPKESAKEAYQRSLTKELAKKV